MKSLVKILILIFLVSTSFIFNAYADTLHLKNGRTMEGIIKAESQDSVDLEVFGGMVRFRKSEIDRIEKSGEESAQTMRSKWDKKRLDTISKAREEQLRKEEEQLKKEFEPKEVEIGRLGGHVLVEVKINRKTDVSLILDTGASCVLLTSSAAKKVGIDYRDSKGQAVELIMADGRKVKGKQVILESVSTQGVEAKNVVAAILPEDADAANFKDGLLGMSFLKNFNFTVDQKNNRLILERL